MGENVPERPDFKGNIRDLVILSVLGGAVAMNFIIAVVIRSASVAFISAVALGYGSVVANRLLRACMSSIERRSE